MTQLFAMASDAVQMTKQRLCNASEDVLISSYVWLLHWIHCKVTAKPKPIIQIWLWHKRAFAKLIIHAENTRKSVLQCVRIREMKSFKEICVLSATDPMHLKCSLNIMGFSACPGVPPSPSSISKSILSTFLFWSFYFSPPFASSKKPPR